jgi:hypothetical protein
MALLDIRQEGCANISTTKVRLIHRDSIPRSPTHKWDGYTNAPETLNSTPLIKRKTVAFVAFYPNWAIRCEGFHIRKHAKMGQIGPTNLQFVSS